MEIIDDKMYWFRTLKDYLEELGLPSSKPYIIGLEESGEIPSPRLDTGSPGYKPRMYTGRQIREIAEVIRGKIR